MSATEYYDFHLAIESDGQGGFLSRILRSLEGRGTATFRLPSATATAAGASLRQDAEARGQALFDCLFTGEAGEKLKASLARLEGFHDGRRRGLRVRLSIDLETPELARLTRLDWEQMFDAENGRFLTRSRRTTLVRDLELRTPLLDLPGARPLRLLVVGAQPERWPALDFKGEVKCIREAWEGRTDVVIEEMPAATLRQLRSRLRGDEAIHILHFIGHGEVDEAEVSGTLIFEGPDHSEHRVTSERLAELFDGDPNLRLVVVNACESAAGPEGAPARGVAARLMKAGVPAVVAMRYKVPDGSAVAFADGFYQALADGLEVDAAMTAARLEIDDTDQAFWHWATPALFMSSLDGRIFKFGGALEEQAMEPKRLCIRSRIHPFSSLEEEFDHVLDLVPFFDGRPIRDPEYWQDKVEPYVDHFFRQHVTTSRPLILRMDAHLTIGFAAGRLIDTRGVDVTLRQATMYGFEDWRIEPRTRYEGPLWSDERSVELPGASGHDLALAVGIIGDNLADVERSLTHHSIEQVGRIVAVTAEPEAGNTVVNDANHALALAQALKGMVAARGPEEREGTLHLFLNTPGAFAFYLGQLSRGFGEIQLYEWQFEEKGSRLYDPSLRIVPEQGGRR